MADGNEVTVEASDMSAVETRCAGVAEAGGTGAAAVSGTGTANDTLDMLAVIAPHALGFQKAGDETGLSVPLPFQNDIVLIEDTIVAGTTHVEDIDELVATLAPDRRLRFERDSKNVHDRWAIRVYIPGERLGAHGDVPAKRIGFVSMEVNEILARLMDGGKHIFGTVNACEKKGDWNQIHMKVYLDD